MRPPDFDELVGDVAEEERERLHRVHELLLAAGPAPELTPKLERPGEPPTADIAQFPKRRHAAAAVIAAAIAAAAFGGGYLVGHAGRGGESFASRETVVLRGTPAAPEGARASIRLGERDDAGNLQMLVNVGGLRKLEPRAYYRLSLQRADGATLHCGDFVVEGEDKRTSVRFTVSYNLREGDRWIVTLQPPGKHEEPGQVLLTT
jgi:hypothetical protein